MSRVLPARRSAPAAVAAAACGVAEVMEVEIEAGLPKLPKRLVEVLSREEVQRIEA